MTLCPLSSLVILTFTVDDMKYYGFFDFLIDFIFIGCLLRALVWFGQFVTRAVLSFICKAGFHIPHKLHLLV